MILEDAELTPYELEVLTSLEHPLQGAVFRMDLHRGSVYGGAARLCAEFVDDRLQHRAEMLYSDPQTPRYAGLYPEAQERGELHLLRASRKRDSACMKAFEDGISEANERRVMRSL